MGSGALFCFSFMFIIIGGILVYLGINLPDNALTRFLVNMWGRNGARATYIGIGILLILMGFAG
jgi:hypothetical protein